MATEVTKFRGGDHTTKLHHTIYSLRHTAIGNAHDSVRGSGLISSISPRMRALFPAWSSADHLVNSSGLSKNVRLSPSIVIDKFDDCGSCLLTLFFHDPVARVGNDAAGYIGRHKTHAVGHLCSERMIRAER